MRVTLALLLIVAGCGNLGGLPVPGDDGSVGDGAVADASAPLDLVMRDGAVAPAPDLASGEGADLSGGPDLSRVPDLSTVVDLSRVADFATVRDLVMADMSARPDLSTLPDLRSPPDLAKVLDLARLPDLVAVADLTAPRDFETARDLAEAADLSVGVTDLAGLGHCHDMVKDGDETDVDCGGSCAPCAAGKGCLSPADCASDLCQQFVCVAPPTCNDGIENGMETGVDCGGGTCPKCAIGKGCGVAADCASGVCTNDVCAASCTDGIKDQDETDVDCGGRTCAPCAVAKGCSLDRDCTTGWCSNGACRVTACNPKFTAGATYGVNGSFVTADFNRDGKLDIAIAYANGMLYELAVLPGHGDGTFGAPVITAVPMAAQPQVADWNGDGVPDLLLAVVGKGQALIGKGDGSFTLAATITDDARATTVMAVGDFNGDKKSDVMSWFPRAVGNGPAQIYQFPGNGDGTFGAQTVVVNLPVCASGCNFISVAVEHASGKEADGVAYTEGGEGNHDIVSTLNGFKSLNSYGAPPPGEVLCGDFNGDGLDDDLIDAPYYLNPFDTAQPVDALVYSLGVLSFTGYGEPATQVGDFNGDGYLDYISSAGKLVCGNGDLTFQPAVSNYTAGVPSGDLNGDGRVDLLSVAGGSLQVLLNAN